MAPGKVDKIQAQLEKLTKRLKVEKARQRDRRRRDDTRRKILLGALVLQLMEKDKKFERRLRQNAEGFFDKPADRKLLGLLELPAGEKAPADDTVVG